MALLECTSELFQKLARFMSFSSTNLMSKVSKHFLFFLYLSGSEKIPLPLCFVKRVRYRIQQLLRIVRTFGETLPVTRKCGCYW